MTLVFFTPKLVLDDRRPWEVLVLKIITNSTKSLEPVESEWTWQESQPLLEVPSGGPEVNRHKDWGNCMDNHVTCHILCLYKGLCS